MNLKLINLRNSQCFVCDIFNRLEEEPTTQREESLLPCRIDDRMFPVPRIIVIDYSSLSSHFTSFCNVFHALS